MGKFKDLHGKSRFSIFMKKRGLKILGSIGMDLLPLGTHLKDNIEDAKNKKEWFRLVISVALALALAAGFLGLLFGKITPETMRELLSIIAQLEML